MRDFQLEGSGGNLIQINMSTKLQQCCSKILACEIIAICYRKVGVWQLFFWVEERTEPLPGHAKKGQSRKQGLTNRKNHPAQGKITTVL